jgi:L-threonylcarbamoyladenylate synthase
VERRILIPHAGEGFAHPLEEAVRVLRGEGLALLPAEGVYGLHARAASDSARRRITRLKGDRAGKAYILLIGDPPDAEPLALIPDVARELIRSAWPGPLTLVMPAADWVPTEWRMNDTVAVRCPSDSFLRALARALHEPLISTSANTAGLSPPARLAEVDPRILAGCDFIGDGGELAGVGSTIVRAEADGGLTLLRSGLWKPGRWKGRMTPPSRT